MDFEATAEQRLLRDSIVRFARAELNPGTAQRDREQRFPRELWQRCAELQLTGLAAPEAFGGADADALTVAIALEALGYGCVDGGLNFSLAAHLLACVVPLSQHGSAAQQQRWLPGLCDGSQVGAHAITETEAGSDSFAMRTRAERVDGGWKLNGSKTFVTNAPVADLVIVFAITDPGKGFLGGSTAFVLERGQTGFRCGQGFEKMGLRSSPVGELLLEDCFVPDDAVLGSVGGGAAVFGTAMEWERSLLVALHVGTIERLLETCIAYTRGRRQFGQVIAKNQAISHRIADMKVQLEAARLLTYRAATRLGRSRAVGLDASMAKLFVSESLVQSALATIQLHGGNGFMSEYEVERALRDAIGSTIYSGTSEMQRNLIARWLGVG